MELYSPIFGEVYLDKIRPHLAIVVTIDKEQGDFKEEFLYDGRYGMNGECMLFPSKGKTTWDGFVPPCPFKGGDILTYTSNYTTTFIYRNKDNEPKFSTSFYVACNNAPSNNFLIYNKNTLIALNENCDVRLATEEEKQKLFDAIKDNGYKWNAKTKTLEKLPRFKVGDYAAKKESISVPILITKVGDEFYYSNTEKSVSVFKIQDQDDWELVPNKFDITTLKPFESRVLVRDNINDRWKVSFWGCLTDSDYDFKYDTVRGCYRQCIPYEGNEHLLGTTNDCDEYFKIWK